MKKTVTLLAMLIIGLAAYSQIKKPDATSVGNSKRLKGAVQPLSELQTYNFVIPKKLVYWTDATKPPGGFHANILLSVTDMKAKIDTKNVSDYTFTLTTPGIQNLKFGYPANFIDKSKVVPYTYTFPCKLQVSNKDGEILRTYILSSDTTYYTWVIHPNFLDDIAMGEQTLTPYAKAGFTQSDDQIMEYITKNKSVIAARIEYGALYDHEKLAEDIIAAAYGYPNTQSKPVVFTLNKKDKLQFSELNDAIDQLTTQITKAYTDSIDDDLQSQLLLSGNFFESAYTTNSTKEMIQLCAFNAAMAYLLAGDNNRATINYKNADKVLGMFSSASFAYGYIFPKVSLMNQLRTEDHVLITPYLTTAMQKRKEYEEKLKGLLIYQKEENAKLLAQATEKAALRKRNIKKKPGYVILKNGDKIVCETISIQYVEDPEMKIDALLWGKVAEIHSGNKFLDYVPRDVQYIMIEEERYESVSIDNGRGFNAGYISDANMEIKGDYFMRPLYQNGDCAAFINPAMISTTGYFIRKHPDEKVQLFYQLLQDDKKKKEFIGTCPLLQKKLDTKTITFDEQGVKQFVDLLQECL
ncbi:MAG: hypothetical protein LBT48_08855 [Prevotellaceae bacterium]|nr:hypothetical protein [Prevotellaceae bacterium]